MAFQKYTGPITVDYNCKIIARSTKYGFSKTSEKEIKNIIKTPKMASTISASKDFATITVDYKGEPTKLYKIDDGEWLNFTGTSLLVYKNCTVYTKSTNTFGFESSVASTIINGLVMDLPVITATLSGDKSVFSVSIAYPGTATNKQYQIDNNGWQTYSSALNIYQNCTIYAKGSNSTGLESGVASKQLTGLTIDVPVISFTLIEGNTAANITINYGNLVTKQYSFDNVTWSNYSAAIKVTKNCTIYAKGKTIVNVESSVVSKAITGISIEAPIITSTLSADKSFATVSVTYNNNAINKLYQIDNEGWKIYTASFNVTKNCTIYAKCSSQGEIESPVAQKSIIGIQKLGALFYALQDNDHRQYYTNPTRSVNSDKYPYFVFEINQSIPANTAYNASHKFGSDKVLKSPYFISVDFRSSDSNRYQNLIIRKVIHATSYNSSSLYNNNDYLIMPFEKDNIGYNKTDYSGRREDIFSGNLHENSYLVYNNTEVEGILSSANLPWISSDSAYSKILNLGCRFIQFETNRNSAIAREVYAIICSTMTTSGDPSVAPYKCGIAIIPFFNSHTTGLEKITPYTSNYNFLTGFSASRNRRRVTFGGNRCYVEIIAYDKVVNYVHYSISGVTITRKFGKVCDTTTGVWGTILQNDYASIGITQITQSVFYLDLYKLNGDSTDYYQLLVTAVGITITKFPQKPLLGQYVGCSPNANCYYILYRDMEVTSLKDSYNQNVKRYYNYHIKEIHQSSVAVSGQPYETTEKNIYDLSFIQKDMLDTINKSSSSWNNGYKYSTDGINYNTLPIGIRIIPVSHPQNKLILQYGVPDVYNEKSATNNYGYCDRINVEFTCIIELGENNQIKVNKKITKQYNEDKQRVTYSISAASKDFFVTEGQIITLE